MALGGAGERIEQRREIPGGGPLIQRYPGATGVPSFVVAARTGRKE